MRSSSWRQWLSPNHPAERWGPTSGRRKSAPVLEECERRLLMTVSISSTTVVEGPPSLPATATFTVRLSQPNPDHPVTVAYQTRDGTSLANVGYRPVSGTLTFQPGEMIQRIDVPVLFDPKMTWDGLFYVTLSKPQGDTLDPKLSEGVAKVTPNFQVPAPGLGTPAPAGTLAATPASSAPLAPPNPAPRLSTTVPESASTLAINNATLAEPAPGVTDHATFTVTLNQPNQKSAVAVDYSTADGTGKANVDYTPVSGTLNFGLDQTTQTIAVPVGGHTLTETNPTFFVNLSSPKNAVITHSQGTGTLTGQAVSPFVVTRNADDTAIGSLRAAIQAADNTPGSQPVTITFKLSPGQNVIQPLTALPEINRPVIIDGTSQPGYTSGKPLVELDGSKAGAQTHGLVLTGGGGTVTGLTIDRFSGAGILLQGKGGNQVSGDFLGTNPNGDAGIGNAQDGVIVDHSARNTIGGSTAATRDVISGNGLVGVRLIGAASTGNLVAGDLIGTDLTGAHPLGNKFDGVFLDGVSGNTIGGAVPAAQNVISGNGGEGVQIRGASARGNLVEGNLIGTDQQGSGALGNALDGVYLNGAGGNTIGGTGPNARNVISANKLTGVRLIDPGAYGNLVQDNRIGTDAGGKAGLGNAADGVFISGAPRNTIGGTTPGAGNLISANGSVGVQIFGAGATGNQLLGNSIGTDTTGTSALGNQRDGVFVNNAPANTIGGTAAGARNLISANHLVGIQLLGPRTVNNVIQGNLIGTDINKSARLENGVGLIADGTGANTVGGSGDARNTVQGNHPGNAGNGSVKSAKVAGPHARHSRPDHLMRPRPLPKVN